MNMDILDKIKLVIETEEDNKSALIRAQSKEKFNGDKTRKMAAMKSLGLKSTGWDSYENKAGEKFSWDGSKFIKQKEFKPKKSKPDRNADKIDGYDRDDLGLSNDY